MTIPPPLWCPWRSRAQGDPFARFASNAVPRLLGCCPAGFFICFPGPSTFSRFALTCALVHPDQFFFTFAGGLGSPFFTPRLSVGRSTFSAPSPCRCSDGRRVGPYGFFAVFFLKRRERGFPLSRFDRTFCSTSLREIIQPLPFITPSGVKSRVYFHHTQFPTVFLEPNNLLFMHAIFVPFKRDEP